MLDLIYKQTEDEVNKKQKHIQEAVDFQTGPTMHVLTIHFSNMEYVFGREAVESFIKELYMPKEEFKKPIEKKPKKSKEA